MIDLHYWPTPNGWKISILLEECGLPYRVVPVNIGAGEQFAPAFLSISPNNRIPAIVDHAPLGGGAPLALFESGAILQYLAEKAGRLLPADTAGRHRVLQWLYWQVGGLGPMAGQNGHFLLYAAEKIPYAIDRYGAEVRRLYGVLDRQLGATGACIAGDYSIADIATFPWVMTHKAQQLSLDDWPHVKRWFTELRARPQVQAGLAVGRELGRPAKAMGDEARRHLFRGTAAAATDTTTHKE
ncbi:glutathione S-transferase N-terminal domain-containing protein [Pseudorhodoferax sp.]|uniref:glutathione S-transferase N-terminal domain-containing protein n=1 Tax=Pseudorhodoferax sp. TaxID=1993553 RepID=UPI002DD662E4|nr:glutathione S-transferase N-terminal domain-containing protein [Pseudorhodoferax sp.]